MQSLGLSKTPVQNKLCNFKNNNRNNTINTISIPIPTGNPDHTPEHNSTHISRTDSKEIDLNLTDQYSLVANVFDPSKMSPPDTWKCRLEQRLKDHNLIYKNNIVINKGFYIS